MKSREGGITRRGFLAGAAAAAAALPVSPQTGHGAEVAKQPPEGEIKERMALLGSRGKGQSRYHLVRHVLEGKPLETFVINGDMFQRLSEEWKHVYESPAHQRNIVERIHDLKKIPDGAPEGTLSPWQQGMEAFSAAGIPPEYVLLSYIESGMTAQREPNYVGASGYFQFTLKSGVLFKLVDLDAEGKVVRDDRTDFAKSAAAAAQHIASDAKLAKGRGASVEDALLLATHKFNGTFSRSARSHAEFLSGLHTRIQSQVEKNKIRILLEQDARPKPPPLRAEYRVVKGDTVSSILRSMGLTKSGLQDVVIENLHRADDLRAGRVYAGDVLLVPISAPAHDMFLAQARTQRAKRMNEQVVADVIRMTEPDPKEDYWQNLDYGAKMRGLLMAIRNPHHRAHELWKEVGRLAVGTPSVPGTR